MGTNTAVDDESALLAQFSRQASTYLDKFDRFDSQEILSFSGTHYILSSDVLRLPTENLNGMASSIALNDNVAVILFPVEETVPQFCYRELHTIVRELTLGMYVLQQTPSISLEANFDQASLVNIPPAYIDTRVGQLLIAVDYMLKSLWHGAYIPKDKRVKFAERWRGNLDVNASGKPETKKSLLTEFVSSGLIDITKDPDFAKAYDKIPLDIPGDAEMAEERRFFMTHADSLSMRITFSQNNVEFYENMFIVDSRYYISSLVNLMDSQIDHTEYERLKTRLQMHEEMLRAFIHVKKETRRQLELLKLVSYLVPFLFGMRKYMKIPDISRLMAPYTSEECRTEKELPPLIVGPEFKCTNFMFYESYFHLHGGITIDIETDQMTDAKEEFISEYKNIVELAIKEFQHHLMNEQPVKEHYNVPTYTISGKLYYAFAIEFETFYGSSPQKPIWVRAYKEEMDKLKLKRLPISDAHIYEHFKKNFGFKKAFKYKTPLVGIRVCAQRGLIAMFNALTRKIPSSRIVKHDEQGLTLLHHAAMYNRIQVIAMLLLSAIDINIRRNNLLAKEYQKAFATQDSSGGSDIVLPKVIRAQSAKLIINGPTALHVAARCGALDAVSCLLANYANILATDQDGWAPIHHAAFFDHSCIIKLMIRKSSGLLELPTKNDSLCAPLLLAATSGALSAVKCLIELGADIKNTDSHGNNIVILATLRFHTIILEYLIELEHPDVPVWNILVEMLNDESMAKKDSAVKCLEVLSTSRPNHWQCILEADAIPPLVQLLYLDNEEIQSVAASVICNTSEQESVRRAITAAQAVPILIKRLSSPIDDIHSRAAIILADISSIDNNQVVIAENGAIPPLINLMDSELEDVLVNAVNCVRVLCVGNKENQNSVAKYGGLEPLVEFLDVPCEDLQAGAAAALATATSKNIQNQNHVIKEGAHKPLVELIRSSRSTTVQVKAASAIEALVSNNPASQQKFLELDAPKALIRLLKNVYVEVREQGACTLWSLAGNTRTQQKYIAERISIPHIIQMLLEPTEKLLYVGCMTAIAIGMENMTNQNKLAAADAFSQLVRLLRSPKTSQKVLHMVIKVLGILCVGVAYKNNIITQRKIAEEGGIPVLVSLLQQPPNEEIQVEVALSLGSVILSFKENQEKLAEEPSFKFSTMLSLLKSKDQEIRLRAGMALTIFAFNNTAQQYLIREAGGIRYSVFHKFIESPDEFYQCYAAFQIVVLARVIIDKEQVPLTAEGIELLVYKLKSKEEKVIVLACSLLSSLAHTRAGLADAMVAVGILDILVKTLESKNDIVRNGAAVTLGYLTFNKTAYRLLFSLCRNLPGLYSKIIENIGTESCINEDFINDFKQALRVGLPSQCLEINGGRPVQKHVPLKRRPMTCMDKDKSNFNNNNRVVSAPTPLWRGHSKVAIPKPTVEPDHTQQGKDEEMTQIRPISTSSRIGHVKTKLSSCHEPK